MIGNVRASRSAFWILGLICLLCHCKYAESQCLPVPTIPFYNPVNPGPRNGIYKRIAEPIKPISVIIHCRVITPYQSGGQSVEDYTFYYSHGAFLEIPAMVSGHDPGQSDPFRIIPNPKPNEIIFDGKPDSPVWQYNPKSHWAGYHPYEWAVDQYSISQLKKIAGDMAIAIYGLGQELQYSHAMVLNTFCLTNPAIFHKFSSWAHRSISRKIMGNECTLYEYIQKYSRPSNSPEMPKASGNATNIYQWWLDNKNHYLLKYDLITNNKVFYSVSILSMKYVKTLPKSLFLLPSGTHVVVWKNMVIPHLQKNIVVTYKRINLGG